MKEVSEKEYREFFIGKQLRPVSSFSDPEGVLPFGYHVPAMDTDWGYDVENVLARCEMRKDNRHQIEWDVKYYIKD